MIQTVEAVIDDKGLVHLLEKVSVAGPRRALVTILEDAPRVENIECALLSEPALAEDWDRPEEEEAWSHLQHGRSNV